jgi:hypothetical protein
MNESINNRLAFNIYVMINFCFTISVVGFFTIFLIENISGKKIIYIQSLGYLIAFLILYMIFRLFDLLIKPAFFEAKIHYGQIYIKSFNPNVKNRFRFILMLFYQKYLLEHTLDRQSYNNYRIEIELFGLKKGLILQKTENGKLFESKSINISFLGAEKYTKLILSIDRLKEKITLN